MDWFILILISVGALSVYNLLLKVLMREETSDPLAFSFLLQLFAAFVAGVFAFWRGFVIPPIQELPLNFILMAFLYAGYMVFTLKSLQTIEASEYTILQTTNAFWIIVVALIFLGETFNMQKVLGTTLIFGGVILVSQGKKGISLTKGSFLALIAAVCFGIALANDTYILRRADAFSYLTIAYFFPSIIIAFFFPSVIMRTRYFLKFKTVLKLFLPAFFSAMAALTFYLAYQQGGGASQLAPISKSVVIVTVLLSAFFLGEKEHLFRKLISAVVVFVGVILLI